LSLFVDQVLNLFPSADGMLTKLADMFREPGISQSEIVQTSFDIQVAITKTIRSKRPTRDALESLGDSLVSILGHLMQRHDWKSLAIISIIPSILHKVDDASQGLLQQILGLDGSFDRQLRLFHAISELSLSKDCSSAFYMRLLEVLRIDSKFGSSLLNIAIFLFESNQNRQWASLLREIFSQIPRPDLVNSALLLRSRRSSLRDLGSSISSEILRSETFFDSDFFLLLVLTSVSSVEVSKALKSLSKKRRLSQCTLKDYPLNVMNSMDVMDCFCCICSSKQTGVAEVARLLSEAFIASRNPEILTFALYNEDESKVLLDATIAAIEMCTVHAPQASVEKLDLVSILYTSSKGTMERLIGSAVNLALSSPSLMQQQIVFLRKMVSRPSRAKLAVNSFCLLLNHSKEVDLEVLQILNEPTGSPYRRSLVFRALSEVGLSRTCEARVRKNLTVREPTFRELFHRDESGLLVPVDFPAATLSLSLRHLGKKPADFLYLVEAAPRDFDSAISLPLQLSLRADAMATLAPFNADAFRIFCEYFRAIEVLAKPDERRIISDWCSLKLPSNFVQEVLTTKKPTKFLFHYVAIRQTVQSDAAVVQACLRLFNATQEMGNGYHPKCAFLLDEDRTLFDDIYVPFREELIVFLAKHVRVGDVDVQQFVDSMKVETLNFELTSRHCDGYLTIFESAFPVSVESSKNLFSILTSLVIDNCRMLARIVTLTLKKSPPDEAFVIANVLLNCATSDDQTVVLKGKKMALTVVTELCHWLRQFVATADEIGNPIVDFMLSLFAVRFDNRSLLRSIFSIVTQIVKVRMKDPGSGGEFKRLTEFKKACEAWFTKTRRQIGVRACGQCSAGLQILVNRHQPEIEDFRLMNKFVSRKFRSRTKWIDEGLKEETDSDDNFADLEGFIVDESQPELDYDEEEDSDID
jgi:hypothetical protein